MRSAIGWLLPSSVATRHSPSKPNFVFLLLAQHSSSELNFVDFAHARHRSSKLGSPSMVFTPPSVPPFPGGQKRSIAKVALPSLVRRLASALTAPSVLEGGQRGRFFLAPFFAR